MLEVFTDPAYLQLLGKGIGLGVGIGALSKVSPQLAVSAAFVAGAWYAWEILAWVEHREELATAAKVVDVEEVPTGELGLVDAEVVEGDGAG